MSKFMNFYQKQIKQLLNNNNTNTSDEEITDHIRILNIMSQSRYRIWILKDVINLFKTKGNE